MTMKTLEPDAERSELLAKWGDATAALVNAYLGAMPTGPRDQLLEALAAGAARLRVEGAIGPTEVRISLQRHDLAEAITLAVIRGGDAAVVH